MDKHQDQTAPSDLDPHYFSKETSKIQHRTKGETTLASMAVLSVHYDNPQTPAALLV